MNKPYKTIALWAVLVLIFYFIYSFVDDNQKDHTEVNFSKFLVALRTNNLTSNVEIHNISNNIQDKEFFWTENQMRKKAVGILTDDMLKQLQDKEVNFKFISEDNTAIWQMLASWLPMILMFLFLFFLMKQFQSSGGKAMSFGKSTARMVSENNVKVTFKDIAGVQEAKAELQEIIEFLKNPKKFTLLGGRLPKGVLLIGNPGTGKTLLARGVAGEASVPFFSISGSDFVEMFVGVGASRVRDLFEQSKKQAPCIIFIDEIDAVGRHRGAGLGGGHDEREQTLNQLLVEMDGFESNNGIILIAATNRVDVLDPALLRPGRFDRRVVVSLPDMVGRHDILKVHSKNIPLSDNVKLNSVARGTPGFSGADLANLVNEAALIAARSDKKKVDNIDFEEAKDKILMGSERKSMIMGKKELENTAYHEAGHTLVGYILPNTDPVHKVTIIPRGAALGLTQLLPTEDRYSYTKNYTLEQICMLFGGRIAEVMTFNELSTGAGNDFQKATELAHKMVCEWGMSETMGPMTFGESSQQNPIFLGREMNKQKSYSEKTAIEIDKEIHHIITTQYSRAEKILKENTDKLEGLALALIKYETLDVKDIKTIMEGGEITRIPPKIKMTTREELEKASKKTLDSSDQDKPISHIIDANLAGSEV